MTTPIIDHTNPAPGQGERIIACIDGARHSAAVCDHGVWAARRLAAPLTLLHALEKPPEATVMTDLSGSLGLDTQGQLLGELTRLDEERAKVAQAHGREILAAASARARDHGLAEAETLQRHGGLVDTLQDLEAQARLVVMGQHDMPDSGSRLYLDPHVERAVRTLRVGMLITTENPAAPERFGIAFDGSETARVLVQRVATSPLLRGLPCQLMMVNANTDKEHEALRWAAATLENVGFEVNTRLAEGDVEESLCRMMTDDGLPLLVMGAYGHSRIREWIVGSTTTTLLRRSPGALLILR